MSSGKTGSMPRQRIHHSRSTYVFPDDFPERLKRFQEESGLSWSEIARRLGVYPPTLWRWRKRGIRPSPAAHGGAAGPGGLAGPGPPVHRLRQRFDRRRCLKRKKRPAYMAGQGEAVALATTSPLSTAGSVLRRLALPLSPAPTPTRTSRGSRAGACACVRWP